ncbi:MAG: hypothetical protein VX777_05340 [Chlamydiota bacterium]|nr:hypothetical protein [Chlamydiota bacterium]
MNSQKTNKSRKTSVKMTRSRHLRLRIFGWTLLTSALAISALTYLSQLDYITTFPLASPEEVENYYMTSFVFAIMGLFCLS